MILWGYQGGIWGVFLRKKNPKDLTLKPQSFFTVLIR